MPLPDWFSSPSQFINLINSLELSGKITLFIQDWGCVVGLQYALRHTDKVARIMCGSCIKLDGACPTPADLKMRGEMMKQAGVTLDEHGRLPLAFCRVRLTCAVLTSGHTRPHTHLHASRTHTHTNARPHSALECQLLSQ